VPDHEDARDDPPQSMPVRSVARRYKAMRFDRGEATPIFRFIHGRTRGADGMALAEEHHGERALAPALADDTGERH